MLTKDGKLIVNDKKESEKRKKQENMARLKSELDKWISMPDKDYLSLIEDHVLLTALKAAGVEELPIYKAAQSVIKNSRVEIHLKPIKSYYK